LALAVKLGATSIAFPSISTGVYGYPREEAARVVWQTLRSYCRENTAPKRIVLVFFSSDDSLRFGQAAGFSE
jgi:O-acetyl-ADP-ribose deacetylase (regulator of RNase III)